MNVAGFPVVEVSAKDGEEEVKWKLDEGLLVMSPAQFSGEEEGEE